MSNEQPKPGGTNPWTVLGVLALVVVAVYTVASGGQIKKLGIFGLEVEFEQRQDAPVPVESEAVPTLAPASLMAGSQWLPMDFNGDGVTDAQFWETDSNGDGIIDYRAFDTDFNGRVDQHVYIDPAQPGGAIYGFDPQETGIAESWGWDTDWDRITDTWAWDLNRNGFFDQWAWDRNRDRVIDLYGYDRNEDGQMEEYREQ
ncbi:MAG: hypothetical protein KF753_12525 [Caldilineaceae bacterium]|nr:hypothetical protein [Caldilineaceae bacterium]